MNTYDYRPTGYLELDMNFDSLSNKERKRLNEAMQQICKEEQQKAKKQSMKFFYSAILPILKGYAEKMEALLTVEQEKKPIVIARLENAYGFEWTEQDKGFKAAATLAHYIDISIEDEKCILSLTFDCEHIIK